MKLKTWIFKTTLDTFTETHTQTHKQRTKQPNKKKYYYYWIITIIKMIKIACSRVFKMRWKMKIKKSEKQTNYNEI